MSVLDKLLQRLTSPYNNDVTSNNAKLLGLAATPLDDTYDILNSVLEARMIDTAFGRSLEYIGSLMGTARKVGETDDAYRARILAAISTLSGGGTPESIRKAVSESTGIDISLIQVIDGYTHGGNYGHFYVFVVGSGYNITEVVELVLQTKAGGILFDGLYDQIGDDNVKIAEAFSLLPDRFILSEGITVASIDTGTPCPLFYHWTDKTLTDSLNYTA